MLSGMILDNFKAFGMRQEIPLAPITLIYGENSAGKSSIIQAILAIKQSINSKDPARNLLVTRGEETNLGSVQNTLFRGQLDRPLSIGFQWSRSLITPNLYGVLFDSVGSEPHRDSFIDTEVNRLIWEFTALGESRRDLRTSNLFINNVSGEEVYKSISTPITLSFGENVYSHGEFPHQFVPIPDPKSLDHAYNIFTNTVLPRVLSELERFRDEVTFVGYEDFDDEGFEREPYYVEDRYFEATWKLLLNDVYLSMDVDARSDVRSSDIYSAASRLMDRFKNYNKELFVEDMSLHYEAELKGDDPLWALALTDDGLSEAIEYGLRRTIFSEGVTGHQWIEKNRLSQKELNAFSLRLMGYLQGSGYFGPTRQRPDRLSVVQDASAGIESAGTVDIPLLLTQDKETLRDVNHWIKRLDIPYSFSPEVIGVGAAEEVIWLKLTDTRTKTETSLVDIGYGVGQLLPIIVGSIASSEKLILIEQPELHLHPRLQSNVADLFISSYQAHENQIIAETHSEQLILRLQRRIREGKLSNQDVCVLYVSRDEDGSHCQQLRLDNKGEFIDEWPHGFFDDAFKEMFSEFL